MLQTRRFYHNLSWSYSQNCLSQSKSSISDSKVTIATMIIKTCYGVQRFKPEVSTLNMKEKYSHLKNVTWPGQPFWFFLIYKTIKSPFCFFLYARPFFSLYTRPFSHVVTWSTIYGYTNSKGQMNSFRDAVKDLSHSRHLSRHDVTFPGNRRWLTNLTQFKKHLH